MTFAMMPSIGTNVSPYETSPTLISGPQTAEISETSRFYFAPLHRKMLSDDLTENS